MNYEGYQLKQIQPADSIITICMKDATQLVEVKVMPKDEADIRWFIVLEWVSVASAFKSALLVFSGTRKGCALQQIFQWVVCHDIVGTGRAMSESTVRIFRA